MITSIEIDGQDRVCYLTREVQSDAEYLHEFKEENFS